MEVLVAVETVLLALLVLLVAGLLRSHAEILRRLGPADESAAPGASDPALPEPPAVITRRAPGEQPARAGRARSCPARPPGRHPHARARRHRRDDARGRRRAGVARR